MSCSGGLGVAVSALVWDKSVTRISSDSLEKMADGEGYLSKKKTLNILKISVAKTRGT